MVSGTSDSDHCEFLVGIKVTTFSLACASECLAYLINTGSEILENIFRIPAK